MKPTVGGAYIRTSQALKDPKVQIEDFLNNSTSIDVGRRDPHTFRYKNEREQKAGRTSVTTGQA